MNKEITKFGDIKIEKPKFHYFKYPIQTNNVDVDKMISNKVSRGKKGFKYFIGYKDDEKNKPFYIMLPKMSEYTNS